VLVAASALAAASSGCLLPEWDAFEMKVRDPHQVAIARGGRTLVPEGARFETAVVIEDWGRQYQAQRTEDGALHLMTSRGWETLVDAGGVVAPRIEPGEPDWWMGERVRAPVCHTARARGHHCLAVELVTPRDNVLHLARTTAPPRLAGLYLGLLGAATTAVNGWLVGQSALHPEYSSRGTVFAISGSLLVVGVTTLAFAGWFAFAPARHEVLVGP
jgi:hypothetical protein